MNSPVSSDADATQPPQKVLLYYLKVEIQVRDGQMAVFEEATVKLLALARESLPSWKLLYALSGISGVPNAVLHLWQLKDANALLEGMQYFASDEAANLYTTILGCCERQRQELFTAKDYSPGGRNIIPTQL